LNKHFAVSLYYGNLQTKEEEAATAGPADNSLLFEVEGLLKKQFFVCKGGINPLFCFQKFE
tara:strand:- start:652 stop:834 length:183 start_codon:yes stop_codon:yes gene_type:complete